MSTKWDLFGRDCTLRPRATSPGKIYTLGGRERPGSRRATNIDRIRKLLIAEEFSVDAKVGDNGVNIASVSSSRSHVGTQSHGSVPGELFSEDVTGRRREVSVVWTFLCVPPNRLG